MANYDEKDLQRAIELSLQPFDTPNEEFEADETDFFVPELVSGDYDEMSLYDSNEMGKIELNDLVPDHDKMKGVVYGLTSVDHGYMKVIDHGVTSVDHDEMKGVEYGLTSFDHDVMKVIDHVVKSVDHDEMKGVEYGLTSFENDEMKVIEHGVTSIDHDEMKVIEHGVAIDHVGNDHVHNEIEEGNFDVRDGNVVKLTPQMADRLFQMVFGSGASKRVISQWNSQGIRFSNDPETFIGLVQYEGGPCGILAVIQAYVLKNIYFLPEELDGIAEYATKNSRNQHIATQDLSPITNAKRSRSLVRGMREILLRCGSHRRAVIADLTITHQFNAQLSEVMDDEVMGKILEGFCLDSASTMQKFLRVHVCESEETILQKLEQMLPLFRSRVGSLIFLLSAVLSRGLDSIQADRDDPHSPLVTTPFGYTTQEVVNLLICGQAVQNVFDGNKNIAGGICLKGVSIKVEVGFLTLSEAKGHCIVGQNLKYPKWPIWILGSETHYSVLYALDKDLQSENEYYERKEKTQRVFNARDYTKGGGYISEESLQEVVRELDIQFPPETINRLCVTGFVLWQEFWTAVLDLEENLGGLRDSFALMGKNAFELFHFNGFAKLQHSGGERKPKLTQIDITIPLYLNDVSNSNDPLVKCIRTRWSRANCSWLGDPPSIC